MRQFEVITDTREKNPIQFTSAAISYVHTRKLDTGDYTIVGLEDVLCIERKGSIAEFYKNVVESRFEDELVRMAAFKYRFLVLEFSMGEVLTIPHSLGLTREQMAQCKMSANFVVKRLAEIMVRHNVNVIFAENRMGATEIITNIMKRIYELSPPSN